MEFLYNPYALQRFGTFPAALLTPLVNLPMLLGVYLPLLLFTMSRTPNDRVKESSTTFLRYYLTMVILTLVALSYANCGSSESAVSTTLIPRTFPSA